MIRFDGLMQYTLNIAVLHDLITNNSFVKSMLLTKRERKNPKRIERERAQAGENRALKIVMNNRVLEITQSGSA